MNVQIKNALYKSKGHDVKFNFNDELKLSKCECGHSWIPKSLSDNKCKKGNV